MVIVGFALVYEHGMCRTYVESQSKRKVSFADRIDARLQQEQERPRTATLKQVQQHLCKNIEANFAEYIKVIFNVTSMITMLGVNSCDNTNMTSRRLNTFTIIILFFYCLAVSGYLLCICAIWCVCLAKA